MLSMVSLVTQMLDLNKKLQDARLVQERTPLSRQIEATAGTIDTSDRFNSMCKICVWNRWIENWRKGFEYLLEIYLKKTRKLFC